jgi:hypothetical protein
MTAAVVYATRTNAEHFGVEHLLVALANIGEPDVRRLLSPLRLDRDAATVDLLVAPLTSEQFKRSTASAAYEETLELARAFDEEGGTVDEIVLLRCILLTEDATVQRLLSDANMSTGELFDAVTDELQRRTNDDDR